MVFILHVIRQKYYLIVDHALAVIGSKNFSHRKSNF